MDTLEASARFCLFGFYQTNNLMMIYREKHNMPETHHCTKTFSSEEANLKITASETCLL